MRVGVRFRIRVRVSGRVKCGSRKIHLTCYCQYGDHLGLSLTHMWELYTSTVTIWA